MKLINLKIAFASMTMLFAFQSNAQQAAHAAGEILVQPQKGINLSEVLRTPISVDGIEVQLEVGKLISRPLNVYKVHFDEQLVNDEYVLNSVKNLSGISIAQFNHFVKNRAEPNDPLYNEQWQYVNTGQSGGTEDADIDIDEAWDVTTGGMTANGDEIVVCVIDDGIDLNHPDLAPNVWTNAGEIADNDIDDDGNGFVDDVMGWNSYDNNDDVDQNGWHGTPVSGIIGAKGDDEYGVAGVNWDVKIMTILGGSGMEAEVLTSYSYPLWFRQKYNETNGAEGAFVVATNASWGIDQGQPEDAPLWCAMYDSLGVHGILNCGATANNNFDIDEVGDLPTACPSDFLISVTNMDHNDEKVFFAGYGTNTIDLGAHGEGTYTVADGSGHAGFGGTSGATPHVCGTIALLYSSPCGNLAEMALEDPMGAASFVRDAIFQGVDPNEDLVGITTQEGRLNALNSMNLIMDNCEVGTLSVLEEVVENDWTLMPNPAQDKITIALPAEKINSAFDITLLDLSGKIIEGFGKTTMTKRTTNLDISNLSPGIYLVKIANTQGVFSTKRFIKE